jgi:3-oxoacyl-[acyl-carrier protein] reductase
MESLKNKVALIAGASRGIGRATAIELAKCGANVVINYLQSDDAKVSEFAKNLETDYDITAMAIRADISDESAVKDMVSSIIAKFGRIDILVNNAGIAIDKDFDDRTLDDWQKTFETNLFGMFSLSKLVGEIMVMQKYGKIVNLSSSSGTYDFSPYAVDYNASKAGIISLTKSLAIQFAPFVNVNAVAPGWVDTDMNKDLSADYMAEEMKKVALGRAAAPKEVAKIITFLASDDASYVNGTTIEVHGGYI